MKLFFKTLTIVLSILLLFAALSIVLLAVPIFGNKALIVRSGSMEPAIGIGSIVVVRTINEPNSLKPGDVIAFRSEKNSNTIITHRISGVEQDSAGITYKTKGDANEEVDNWVVRPESILGKSYLTLPQFGKVLTFARSEYGFPLLIIFPAVLVILLEFINIIREIRKRKKSHNPNMSDIFKEKFEYEKFSERQSESPNTQSIFDTPPFKSKRFNFLGFKLLLIPLIIIGCSLPATFAFYSDTETSVENVFQAAAFGPQVAQTLVINEVLPDSSCFQGQTEAQWLEIYNGYSTTVNLKNFKITDGTNTIDLVNAASVEIAPGGFVLLAHSTSIFGDGKCYPDNGTEVANLGGQLNIDTGFLRLLDSNDNIIDTVMWPEDGLDPAQNESIEREPTGIDTAFGEDFEPTDFEVRVIPNPGL